jgi:trehalose 6-phosphate synthase/phosphatase
MKALHRRVLRNNVFRWGERFLSSLEEAVARGSDLDSQPKQVAIAAIREAYRQASRRLLISHYDGTLVPFTNRPQQAAPPPAVVDTLATLAADPRNLFALTSGRRKEDLEGWFGTIPGIWLIAEHGAELRQPDAHWSASRPLASTNWKSTVMPILEHFVDRTPGSFVEEKKYSLAWHYRMAEPEFAA